MPALASPSCISTIIPVPLQVGAKAPSCLPGSTLKGAEGAFVLLSWISLCPVDPFAAEHGRGRSHLIELMGRDSQGISVEHDQIGQLARGNRALPVLAAGDVRTAKGVGAERLLGCKGLAVFAQIAAGRRGAIDRGVYPDPGVVVGDIRV